MAIYTNSRIGGHMLKGWFAALAAITFVCSGMVPQTVDAKTKSDSTFSFPKDKPIKIAVFRPDVEVATIGVAPIPTPNADWTAQARKNISDALIANQNAKDNQVVFFNDTSADDGAYLAEYQSLYRAVGSAMLIHSTFLKLPTKKQADGKYRFDWTLGPGASRLGEIAGGADYGLFLYSYDAHATASRVIVGFLLTGQPLGAHSSYAALIDFKTGNIVWINFYLNKKGDIRTPEGAVERVNKLLSTMPLREGEVRAKPARK
jgi:hypothetical protein